MEKYLIGFGDFFSGYDDIGAADRGYGSEIGKTPSGKGKGKPAPAGAKKYPPGRKSTVVEYHGKVLQKSRGVLTKAAKTIGLAQHLLSRKPAAVSLPSGRKIPGPVHVGDAAAAVMSPKAKLAIAKHNAAVLKSKQAGKVLAQHALQTKKSVEALAKKMVIQKKTAKTLRTPLKSRVHVGALLADPVIGEAVAEMIGEYYDAVGADPDPKNPGFLTDGSPDPAAGAADASSAEALAEDPADSGATLPAPLGMEFPVLDMEKAGGIAYDGSLGMPDGCVGSYGLFTRSTDHHVIPDATGVDGTEHYGYVWGKFHDKAQPGGLPFGDDLAAATWNHVGGPGSNGRHDVFISGPMSVTADASEAYASASKNNKYGTSYGPLVGNPGMKKFAGMRVDAQGNMFWLPQEAPDWLTFPIKQAAALTAQAAKKAEEEAAKAAAAAEAKARADEASAKAATDAANALDESKAASESKVTQTKEEAKQTEAETQAQQALVQQQTAETTAKTAESEQMKQAGELMLAQARRQSEYLAAHPEEEFGPAPSGGEEDVADAAEGSLEGDVMEDGEPLPGGDVMHDADGEGFQE